MEYKYFFITVSWGFLWFQAKLVNSVGWYSKLFR